MLQGLFGAIKSAVIAVAHSTASRLGSLLAGYQTLQDVGIEITKSQFSEAFEQFETIPQLRQDIYDLPSDRLIPGRLHKESGFAPKGQYYYAVFSDYTNPKGEQESAILTIRSDKRMSLDEILHSPDLPACSESTVGDPEEMRWDLLEAWVGV